MKLFYILVVVVFGFNACDNPKDELPTITLEGPKEITLKIDTFISEPGYSAYDPQDGDLTKDVNVSTNLDYSREGEYEVKYFTMDKDGNTARQSRKITIIKDGSNSYEYKDYISDSSLYYLPSFFYDYRTLVNGDTINHTIYTYDLDGNRLESEDKSLTYKKSNDAIYKELSGEDTKHDILTLDELKSYNNDNKLVSKYPIKMRIDNTFIDDNKICQVVKYIENFTTEDATDTLNGNIKFFYLNVLNIECIENGKKENFYYAKGIGEVLRITDDRILLLIR